MARLVFLALACLSALAQEAEPVPVWVSEHEQLALFGQSNVCLRFSTIDELVESVVGFGDEHLERLRSEMPSSEHLGPVHAAWAHLTGTIGRFLPTWFRLPFTLPEMPSLSIPTSLLSIPAHRAWSRGVVTISGLQGSEVGLMIHSDPSLLCAALDVVLGEGSVLANAMCSRSTQETVCTHEQLPGSTEEVCVLHVSTFHNPCVLVDPERTWTAYYVSLRVEIDYLRPAAFAVGTLLMASAVVLSRARIVHYAVGASMGVAVSILAAAYFLYRHSRNMARAVPGGEALMTYSSVAMVMMPATGYFFFQNALDSFGGYALQQLFWLWAHPSHYGKAYFLIAGTVGMIVIRYKGYFTAHSCEECDDVAVLECAACRAGVAQGKWRLCADCHADYQRIDEDENDAEEHEVEYLSLLGQHLLEKTFWGAGVFLLLHSTNHVVLSVLLTLAVSHVDNFVYMAWTLRQWWAYRDPARFRKLLSAEQYEDLGERYTQMQLDGLRAHLSTNPLDMEKVHEDHEIRLRRFVHGAPHVPVEEEDTPTKRSGGSLFVWLLLPLALAAAAAAVAYVRPDLVDLFQEKFRDSRYADSL